MADEKTGKGTEPFQLGGRYDEAGPELGILHDARNARTGRPVLMLIPGAGVEWRPGGEWRLRVSCQPEAPSVTLEVERAPDSAEMKEMANILVLVSAAVECVEDNPRLREHLMGARERPWAQWGLRAVAGLAVVALVLGVWLHGERDSQRLESTVFGMDSWRPSQMDAPDVINTADSDPEPVAYPLPYEPFRNQAKAPCRTKDDEVEINGGCWMELARRPPCSATQAEYQGKCYMPVSKDRGRVPRSVQP